MINMVTKYEERFNHNNQYIMILKEISDEMFDILNKCSDCGVDSINIDGYNMSVREAFNLISNTVSLELKNEENKQSRKNMMVDEERCPKCGSDYFFFDRHEETDDDIPDGEYHIYRCDECHEETKSDVCGTIYE